MTAARYEARALPEPEPGRTHGVWDRYGERWVLFVDEVFPTWAAAHIAAGRIERAYRAAHAEGGERNG